MDQLPTDPTDCSPLYRPDSGNESFRLLLMTVMIEIQRDCQIIILHS